MQFCKRSLLVLVAVSLVSVFALRGDDAAEDARPAVTSVPDIDAVIEQAIQSRSYEAAVTAIDAELGTAGVEHADYLLYLKGRALTELGRFDEAVAAFQRVEEEFADGDWVSRARFGRADVFVRSRRYQAAGEIYREEANRLLSRDRKDELAAIYLEFADLYYEGVPAEDPSQEKQPDYQQALTYYQQALPLGPTRPLRQKIEFRIARCQQELGNQGEAIAAYQQFLAQHAGEDVEAEQRAEPVMVADARFQLGVTQLAAGQPVEARKTWQQFLDEWAVADEVEGNEPQGASPGSTDESETTGASALRLIKREVPEAITELLAKSAYRLAHTYGVPSPGSDADLELGVAAAERFIATYPEHELAPQAELEIAQSYVARNRHPQAVARLTALIGNAAYAESKVIPEARYLLGSALAAQEEFEAAIAAWKEFLEAHPTDPKWSDAQRAIVDTEYAMAEHERSDGEYAAARELWETFLNKYPLDGRAAQVLFNFGSMHYSAAIEHHTERVKAAIDEGESAQSVEIDDESRQAFENAIADWRRLVSKYPGSNEASQAAYMIGMTLESHLGRLKEALTAYQQVTGASQPQAQERMAGLTNPQLEVSTERKFRSDEQPRIRITTRNLENVTVKAYRIDMADYFRKMHLASGVETLDIALIDPDEQFEHEVAGYEQYRRIEQDVEIPVEGPGVTAVTVSSDKQEATTMLVVSDLDIIVKTSRNELFLFAQNMRTGQPAVGASVLISDGSEIFAETVTGENGILQESYEELKSVADLRVFAVQEGHAASTVTNLNGLDFAVGLTPKGYLYTDRPAYRAGQLVNIRAIVRWVDEDRLTFEAGEKYQLDVYDARSRLVHTQDVALNDFGAVADNFILPTTSPQGSYRVHLHQPAGNQSYETTFTVAEYRLEPVQLTIDLPQQVYYRGDTVEATISLKYYYGAALAERSVMYQFGDSGWLTGTTDENGEIAVTFETEQYRESQPIALSVQFPERSLATGEMVFLATRGFEIGVSTLRDVYIDGETFDATLNVRDAAGDPVATELKVEVFEVTSVRGETGERLVSEHEVTTDEEEGNARQNLALEEGGRYIVRATGTDQFGNTISGQTRVFISGEKDAVRLRILADQHYYQVGDDAQVRLHWREAPALALVTYEGASILGYQLVELQTGENQVTVQMGSELAPNFNLSVAVMERNRFHAAGSEFRVAQKLNVALTPSANELKPGEDLTVDIEVTDPQGDPVSAELSLALVQANLLNMYGDVQGVIETFFGAGERTPSIRDATSCTFTYAPSTQEISRYLLAEAERQQILSREAAALASHAVDGVMAEDLSLVIEQLQERRSLSVSRSDSARQSGREHYWNVLSELEGSVVVSGEEERLRRTSQEQQQSGQAGEWGRFGGGGFGGVQDRVDYALSAPDAREITARWSDDYRYIQAEKAGLNLALGLLDADADGNWEYVTPESFVNGANVFYSLANAEDFTVNGVLDSGIFLAVNGRSEDELKSLGEQGLRLLPGMSEAETAFWNPVIVTGEDGKATVTIQLPERSTAWKLRGKGINGESLAGQAEVDLVTKKDLFGELKLPLAFTTGDTADVLVEVHNSLEGARGIDVTLTTTIGEKTTEIIGALDVEGPGIHDLSFPVEIEDGDQAEFQLTVVTTDGNTEIRDTVQRTVAIRPYGFPVYATASGTAAQSTLAFVQFDENTAAQSPSLEIVIGPTVNRALLDAVIGGGFYPVERCAIPVSGIERAVSDVIGGVALLEMIGATRETDTPEAEALAGRIASAISLLVSSQRDDGFWSWSGRPDSGEPDHYLSSRAVWALASAREAGFAVQGETFDRAVQGLRTAFAATSQTNREAQAILLLGLAKAGQADFAAANRLHRERNSLSDSGLLHVALVLIELDRKEMAAELLRLVESGEGRVERQVAVPWMRDGTEVLSLHLLALEAVEPGNARVSELAEQLLAARVGSRWPVEKANGPAVAALAEWYARSQNAAEKYTLTVFVNDQQVEEITVDPATDGSRRISVSAELLAVDRPQRINFDLEGRGRFSYSAVLTGFVPAADLKSTTNDWSVTRRYEPAQRMLDGQWIPRGFGSLTGNYEWFSNPLTQLPVGERGEVTLSPRRRNVRNAQDEEYDYLIVTEPVPAGCTVLTESISGDFERYELEPGSITFYVGDKRYPGDIGYTLVGYLPGSFHAAPTLVRSFYEPQRMAVADTKELAVLPSGAESQDEYRLTPDELFHLGSRLVAKGEFAAAHQHLTELFNNWRLNDDVAKQTVQHLFTTSLKAESHGEIVKFFEIIKEKYADVQVTFEDILTVADSYRQIGEYERSYLVYRSTVEGSFERESQVAGFLNARGEFLRSVSVMEDLLRDYPAESYVAIAAYSLAQEVYARGPVAAQDEKLVKAGVTRVDLIASAIDMLDHFLTVWPEDPAADQASFAAANALLDLDQFEAAIARCEEYAERYPESRLLDSYWYIIGYAHFALKQHEEALEMCRKVAEAMFPVPETGGERPADNKWEAVYIMGQVYHSLGQPADAIQEYERVDDRFTDAAQAIEFFTRQDIGLEEVTTLHPDDAKQLTLNFRNIPSASIMVYRIDLMKFGLMQRNLDQITAINLAGIKPHFDETVELGDGKDYRDREQTIDLPLEDEGAYLVVCRGDNLYASGLVLVSPLELEVQEDAVSGRVRVTVKDATEDRYADDVHVKVIGSANDEFISGETDLRGLFVADNIRGTSTVIAMADEGRYAFFRGATPLQPAEPAQPPAPSAEAAPAPMDGEGEAGDALRKNLFDMNSDLQEQQRGLYRQLLENDRSGVEASEAF